MAIFIGLVFPKKLNGLLLDRKNGSSICVQPNFSTPQLVNNSLVDQNNFSNKFLAPVIKTFSYLVNTATVNYLPNLNTSKITTLGLNTTKGLINATVNYSLKLNTSKITILELNTTKDLITATVNYISNLNTKKVTTLVLNPSSSTLKLKNISYTSNLLTNGSTIYYQNSVIKMISPDVTLVIPDTALFKPTKSISRVSNSTFISFTTRKRNSLSTLQPQKSIYFLSNPNTHTDFSPTFFRVLKSTSSINEQFDSDILNTQALLTMQNERFAICQQQENVCLNTGICYMSSENKFCRCTGDYIGLLCETKAYRGMNSIDIWLGSVCGGLLLLLIITTVFVYKKLNKADKDKSKLQNELKSVKSQRVKLIAEYKTERKRFSCSEYSFNASDYFVPQSYKPSLSDRSFQTSINEFECNKNTSILTETIDEEDSTEPKKIVQNEACLNQENTMKTNSASDDVLNSSVQTNQPNISSSSPSFQSFFRAQSLTDLNTYGLNRNSKYSSKNSSRYDVKSNFGYKRSSKSLEILNGAGINQSSKQYLKNRSNESIFTDNMTRRSENMNNFYRNRKISELSSNKKQKGIWAQEQERKKDFM